jgi:hypothetical protein
MLGLATCPNGPIKKTGSGEEQRKESYNVLTMHGKRESEHLFFRVLI